MACVSLDRSLRATSPCHKTLSVTRSPPTRRRSIAGVQDRGISGLVDVVEDVVEGTFEVLQNSLRIADENLDLWGDAGLLHVLPGNRRGLGIVLDRDKLAVVG